MRELPQFWWALAVAAVCVTTVVVVATTTVGSRASVSSCKCGGLSQVLPSVWSTWCRHWSHPEADNQVATHPWIFLVSWGWQQGVASSPIGSWGRQLSHHSSLDLSLSLSDFIFTPVTDLPGECHNLSKGNFWKLKRVLNKIEIKNSFHLGFCFLYHQTDFSYIRISASYKPLLPLTSFADHETRHLSVTL